jgi:Zn finger protein HypA/HybF involved in hydrogenase expression
MPTIQLTCRQCGHSFPWIGARFIRLCPECRAAEVKRMTGVAMQALKEARERKLQSQNEAV